MVLTILSVCTLDQNLLHCFVEFGVCTVFRHSFGTVWPNDVEYMSTCTYILYILMRLKKYIESNQDQVRIVEIFVVSYLSMRQCFCMNIIMDKFTDTFVGNMCNEYATR